MTYRRHGRTPATRASGWNSGSSILSSRVACGAKEPVLVWHLLRRCHVVNIDPKPLTKPNFFLRVLCSLYVYGYSMRVLMPSLGRDVTLLRQVRHKCCVCIHTLREGSHTIHICVTYMCDTYMCDTYMCHTYICDTSGVSHNIYIIYIIFFLYFWHNFFIFVTHQVSHNIQVCVTHIYIST